MDAVFQKIGARYRYSVILLRELVVTDFKVRYQGSLLGYLWSLLRPLMIFLILYLVFTKFLPVGKSVEHYPQYLLVGIVLWNYFGEVTSGSVGAIVGKGDLLRKINFPRYVIILAGSISALINLGLNAIIVAVFMFVGDISVDWSVLMVVPLVAELFVLALALAFLLSALFVKFRDVSYIWEVIMQAAFYATPILYPLGDVPRRYAELIILNPVAQIIQDIRRVLIPSGQPTIRQIYQDHQLFWYVPFAIVGLVAVFSVWYFRGRSKYFAEEV